MYYSGQWHPSAGHHGYGCQPTGYPAHGHGGWGPCVVLVCPPPCGTPYPQRVPHELSVDAESSPRQVLVGGKCDVHLSLEYLADEGDAAPSIEVRVIVDGTTSTWSESPIPSGYQVRDDFLTVKPGSRVEVTVTQAMARLRWCETICC
jgi:hypothetical protein